MASLRKKPSYKLLSSGRDENGIELGTPSWSTPNTDEPAGPWTRQTAYKPVQLNPDEVAPTKRGIFGSGWRVGAITAATIASLSLIINFIATTTVKSRWGFAEGTSILYTGDCDRVQRYDTWIHLAINAISTALLSGSNYCMQVLCAPNRREVDNAHEQRKYLDIGVPSARNLGFLQKHKRYLWYALGLSSLPLHLLYNSVVFNSLSTNDYNVYWAQESFLTGAAYDQRLFPDGNNSYPSIVQKNISNTRIWTNLTNEECISVYTNGILSDRRDVVLIHDNSSDGSLSKMISYHSELAEAISYTSFDSFAWVCEDNRLEQKIQAANIHYPTHTYNVTILATTTMNGDALVTYTPSATSIPPTCRELAPILEIRSIAAQWSPSEYNVQYCMSEKFQGECNLKYSLPIAIVVMTCNIFKIVAMCYVSFWITDSPLITFGDAVASFLERPDPVTKGGCLATNDYFWKNWNGEENDFYQADRLGEKPMTFYRCRTYLRTAGHTVSWFVLTWLFFFALVAIGVLLRYGLSHLRTASNDAVTLWAMGFGKPHEENLIGGGYKATNIIAAVLIANLPQPFLSFLYLLFNGMLTAMLSAHEWSHYSKDRKPLRVSTPRGSQRSTYFLQLPYRFSIPLMLVSGTLHWLVSQSVFLANITTRQRGGYIDDDDTVSTAGYSPMAIICTLGVGGLMLVCITASSFLKVEADIPFVGSCSAAISAACHGERDGSDAALGSVRWGAMGVVGDGEVGHCGFSTQEVGRPVEGALYA